MPQVEFRTSRDALVRVEVGRGDTLVIGQAPENKVVVAGNGVHAAHAILDQVDGGIRLRSLGDAPVLINGHPLANGALLKDGDWVGLGAAMLQVRLPAEDSNLSVPATHLLPDYSGQIVVGRVAGCGLVLDSPLVSREHARLLTRADGLYVEDLHSTNGTWINTVRIDQPHRLRVGDRVAFAACLFT